MAEDIKPEIVPNAAKIGSGEKIFELFKTFIAQQEFGHALRSFINPKKVPGLTQSHAINPQMINVANAKDRWDSDSQPESSDWVVTQEDKHPLGIYIDQSKVLTYAPFGLPGLLPKRIMWVTEFMPAIADDQEREQNPAAALRFRFRCGTDKWFELVSEPIEVTDKPVRFGFEVPLGKVRMDGLFECLMGVTPMTDTPIIVRAAWLKVFAFE